MEVELSRFQKENNMLDLRVAEEHKKLKAKEEEMIMERTKVQYRIIVFLSNSRDVTPADIACSRLTSGFYAGRF